MQPVNTSTIKLGHNRKRYGRRWELKGDVTLGLTLRWGHQVSCMNKSLCLVRRTSISACFVVIIKGSVFCIGGLFYNDCIPQLFIVINH